MSNDKEDKPSDKKSGNGQHKYPKIVTDGFKPNPDVPGRYTYEPEEKEETRKRFFTFSEIVDSATSVEWLVKNYLETNSLGLFYGDASSFKSFVVLDIGLCIAYGIPWHGNPVKQGIVVYVCGEGQNGLARRLMGWKGEFAEDKPRPDETFIITREFDFCSLEDTLEFRTNIDNCCSIPPSLIIIDTLARNFGSGNENATEDMNRFVNNIVGLLLRPYKATLLILHHVGHGDKQRARGASTLRGALDFEYRLERHNDSVAIHNTKMKDGPIPESIMLDSFDVDTPYASEDGHSYTSLALTLNPDGAPAPKTSQKRSGINQEKAIEALKKAFKEMELNLLQDNREPLDFIYINQWRDSANLDRKRFREVQISLVKNGTIEIQDGTFVKKGPHWDD